jgi:K+-sensing histidine kinase KdpD
MTKEVHLNELIERAARGFDPKRLHVEPLEDVIVETDDLAVYEVLGVFIENAFKHSPEGTRITIASRIEDGIAEIAVANQGSLPPNLEAADLFQPFQRGSNTEGRGVGLGLYIAARLADAINGKVSANAVKGEIAFILRFPTDETVVARMQTGG